jgi:hypothetical protein
MNGVGGGKTKRKKAKGAAPAGWDRTKVKIPTLPNQGWGTQIRLGPFRLGHPATWGTRRMGDSASRLAVKFGYADVSRRRLSECLATIAGREQEEYNARRGELSGPVNRKAKTKTNRFSIRWERFARTRAEPRYEISLGSDGEERQECDAVLRRWKVYCGRGGGESTSLRTQELGGMGAMA